MHEDSIEKTAFSTQDHHWEFVRCPFGLKNMPSDFSRIMYLVLGDLPYVQIYLDDFSIHSASFEEHIKHIETVLDKL
jgi:putative transposase